jgi:NADH-quinone oxidoreductase subunit C
MESNKAELTVKIIEALKDKYEDQVLGIESPYEFLTVSLKQEKIVEVIQYLCDHPDTGFRFLTTLCGIHYPEQNAIAVMYQLHNMITNQRIRLKIFLPADNPVTPTITSIFSGANWMERETYDFFGVVFQGHPNLKRILNVEEMIMFPMRKEFPLEDQVREDKSDRMFGR